MAPAGAGTVLQTARGEGRRQNWTGLDRKDLLVSFLERHHISWRPLAI